MGLKFNVQNFLAGLAAPNQHGGLFGGFQAGLGGALNQRNLQQQQAQAQAKAQIEQDLERRRVAASEQSSAADMLRAGRVDPGSADVQAFNLLTKLGIAQPEAIDRVWPQHRGEGGPQETGVAPMGFLGPLPPGQIHQEELPAGIGPQEYPAYRKSMAQAAGYAAGKGPGKGDEDYTNAPWYLDPRYRNTPEAKAERARLEKSGAPDISEKLAERVRLINAMDPMDKEDFETLLGIVSNPPSPEEQAAARGKLKKRIAKISSPRFATQQ